MSPHAHDIVEAQELPSSTPVSAGIEQRWYPLSEAPLKINGHVWCPELRDRTDGLGSVYEHSDGSRGVSSSFLGYEFTHWHPLPAPPTP